MICDSHKGLGAPDIEKCELVNSTPSFGEDSIGVAMIHDDSAIGFAGLDSNKYGKISLLTQQNTPNYSVTLDLSNLSSNTEAKTAIESASNLQLFCPVRKLMICDRCGRGSRSSSIEKCEFCASPYFQFRYSKLSLNYDRIIQSLRNFTLICNLVHRSLKSLRMFFKVTYYLILAQNRYILFLKYRLSFTKIPRTYTLDVFCFTKLMLLSRSPCIGLVLSKKAKAPTNQKSYSYVFCRSQ